MSASAHVTATDVTALVGVGGDVDAHNATPSVATTGAASKLDGAKPDERARLL